jgi:hypothetical protein
MKLYEVSNFIRKIINYILGFIIIISLYIYVQPIISEVFLAVKPAEAPEIPFKLSRINFTIDQSLNFNLSNTRINYLGNPDSQWQNQAVKKLKVYTYNFSSFEDIDYTPKAKQIALGLGYDDLNQRDNAELSNKYVWIKNGLIFEIDKVTKKMIQIPQQTDFSFYKQYLSSGNFITSDSPKPYIINFLNTTGRFTQSEITELELEPQFIRFESNNLVDSNNIASELSYVKVFRKLDDLKVVSKRYEFPQIYFYVSSLRPEIETNFKNYRFMHFKINKLNYSPAFDEYEFDLLPLPFAVDELRQGNFIVSDIKFAGDAFAATPNPSEINIQTITFDSYELGYYDNYEETLNNEFIQPVYVFRGTLELVSGSRGRITVYIPAVDPRFFIN